MVYARDLGMGEQRNPGMISSYLGPFVTAVGSDLYSYQTPPPHMATI